MDKVDSETIYSKRCIILHLHDNIVHQLKSDWTHEGVVVLIDEYVRDVGGNPVDSVASRVILLRQKINIVGDQLCLNVFIVFKHGFIFHSKDGDFVVHYVLDSRSVKKRGVAFSLFYPADFGFLFPDYFLFFAFLQFGTEALFLCLRE
jgi:hypothetical protein